MNGNLTAAFQTCALALVVGVGGFAGSAQASIVEITSLDLSNAFSWKQIPSSTPSNPFFSSPVTVTSTGGNTASVDSGNHVSQILVSGKSWPGYFTSDNSIFYATQGPFTFTLSSPVNALLGAWQPDFYGNATIRITAEGINDAVLGSILQTVNSTDVTGTASPFGVATSNGAADIYKIVVSLPDFPQDGIGADTLYIGSQNATPTPLPPTWTMMLIGFAGLGLADLLRSRRPTGLVAS